MSRHRKANVISYNGALCHDMSYVTTIVASLLHTLGNKAQDDIHGHNNYITKNTRVQIEFMLNSTMKMSLMVIGQLTGE